MTPTYPAPIVADLALITSEHSGQPNYVASVSASIQPFADLVALLASLPDAFDIDGAVGAQEDAVGVRVGRSRNLEVPANVFFSWGIDGLGWGQGVWKGPFDSATGLARLPDEPYRFLLRATAVANSWDGTVPGAYAAWATLFSGTGYDILIQDYGDDTMGIVLIGQQPDAITQALFTTGELDLKPAGKTLVHFLPTVWPAGVVGGVRGTPVFGWGVDNANIGGWGRGAWATPTSSE